MGLGKSLLLPMGGKERFALWSRLVLRICNWHDRAPGVNRVTLDYAGMISSFDPKYTDLVRARERVDGKRWRVGNITKNFLNVPFKPLSPTLPSNWHG